MAGRYYPGVDSERVSRKAEKLRVLTAWAKSMEQKKATGKEQAGQSLRRCHEFTVSQHQQREKHDQVQRIASPSFG